MQKEVEKYLRLKRKLIVLEYARVFGSNLEAYKACGIPKSTFYDWKKAFEEEGEGNPGIGEQGVPKCHHDSTASGNLCIFTWEDTGSGRHFGRV